MAWVMGGGELEPDGGPLDAARGITLGVMLSSVFWMGLAATVLTLC